MITRRKFIGLLAALPVVGKPLGASLLKIAAAPYCPPTTMKILRDSTEIGVVDLLAGELDSTNGELSQLWNRWLEDGFKVLGPGPEEPPGVYVDALYTIYPGPDNMGLVAIELGRHGYDLEFC